MFFLLVLMIFGWSPEADAGGQAAARHRIECVVIDAGHGGKDHGAISANFLREKELALDIAAKTADELRRQGLRVLMTRRRDVFVPLAKRAKIANKKSADLFVSIHINASESAGLKGFEVYHLSEAVDDHALAVERAENSALSLGGAVSGDSNQSLRTILWDLRQSENRRESILLGEKIAGEARRGAPTAAIRLRGANFYVLRWSECPAVLVEAGYLTNPSDEIKLKSARYRQKLASAIVKGIISFKNTYEQSNGFTA